MRLLHQNTQLARIICLVSIVACLPFLMSISSSVDAANATFERRPLGDSIASIRSIATGDMDGDGDLDIVTGNEVFFSRNTIYFNDGTGNFPTQHFFGREEFTGIHDLVLADMDGDGDLDIVAAGNVNAVYVNDGSGTSFTEQTFGPTGDSSSRIAVGDIDGDSDFDIIANDKTIYLNDGTGQFPVEQSLPGPLGSGDVVIGDIDGDSDLDIITGEYIVYLNDGIGTFSALPSFAPQTSALATHLVLGDMGDDGDLDLIALDETDRLSAFYINDGSGVFERVRGFTSVGLKPHSITAGDINSDGRIDLVVGYESEDVVYFNGGGHFSNSQFFGPGDRTYAVALGDLDVDGDLDIVTATGLQGQLYFNQESPGFLRDTPIGEEDNTASDIVLGDLNNDTYLDMVVGSLSQNRLYFNDGNGGFLSALPFGPSASDTRDIAIGDIDGDADLDIITSSDPSESMIYTNAGNGTFPVGVPLDNQFVGDVVLGDIDNDQDLDIVAGNRTIYLNDGAGRFPDTLSFDPDGEIIVIKQLVLGDLDNDGDLDIVTASGSLMATSYVLLNDGEDGFSITPLFDLVNAQDVALGDVDGDGDLDIVGGGVTSAVFLNDGNGNFPVKRSLTSANFTESSVAVGDMDGDGDLDIVLGREEQEFSQLTSDLSFVYRNDGNGNFPARVPFGPESISSEKNIALGDINSDGTLDIVNMGKLRPGLPFRPVYHRNTLGLSNGLPNDPPRVVISRPGNVPDADFFSTPELLGESEQVISVPYTLSDPEGDEIRMIKAFYSLDGSGNWIPAVAAAGTETTNLAAGVDGTDHVFTWDLFKSGVFGQADNVVFRIEAYPGIRPNRNAMPALYQHTYIASTTFPFRVRGTQVRVQSTDETAVSGALVYRLPAGSIEGAERYARNNGIPFRTDGQGFLQGRGVINPGDTLIALAPVAATETYSLYHTNATPTPVSIDVDPITTPGVQNLTVSSDHPLVLFNLDLSLEWDARNDSQYLARLEEDLQRTSAMLYDLTDGQAALGDITIFHDRENWNTAHIRIYATNRLRPNANQGGIVSGILSETVSINGRTSTVIYEPGQIRMGAVWNRYGEADGTIGEDWPRTLAHELGHFALFLDDNYLGIDENGLLTPVQTCPGAMTDPYIDNNSELHPLNGWLTRCSQTLSQQITGRSDWETIITFYDGLQEPESFNANPGPQVLPFEVTQVRFVEPDGATKTLETPIFYLTDERNVSVQPDPDTRAFLFQTDQQRLIDLGSTVLDRVDARGARPGDRLCVSNLAQNRWGCEQIRATDQQIRLNTLQKPWQPDLIITPVTSRTVEITVQDIESDLVLQAQLFPVDNPAPSAIALTEEDGQYTGRFDLADPAFAGHVHIWVQEEEPRREFVSNYTIGGNPGSQKNRNVSRSNPGSQKNRNAPVLSSDGQAIIYTTVGTFSEGSFYTIQATNAINPPTWVTPIGQAYRVIATDDAPELQSNATINIGYLSREVIPGGEDWIRVYVLQDDVWQVLPTTLDTNLNLASAPIQGPGVYALMSSVEIPLIEPGWHNVPYPVRGARAVDEALASASGAYTSVWEFTNAPQQPIWEQWRGYHADTPAWVSDLKTMAFGKSYWMYITRATTLYFGDNDEQIQTLFLSQMNNHAVSTAPVPSVYYGEVQAGTDFVPTANMTVQARINGALCGVGNTQEVNGAIVYRVTVVSAGCSTGDTVTFSIDGYMMLPKPAWSNTQANYVPLQSSNKTQQIFLPLMQR